MDIIESGDAIKLEGKCSLCHIRNGVGAGIGVVRIDIKHWLNEDGTRMKESVNFVVTGGYIWK